MKKVLVVEDNSDNLRLISYALKRSGYEVISAETGEDGVKLAVKVKPFFIVADINLPGMDGVEMTRVLRGTESCSSTPIIAITSHAMTGDRERVMAAGCNAYFEKPIDPLTIMECIHGAIRVGTKGGDGA